VYEVRVHEQAQATLDALLAEVIVAYMGVLDVLEVAPWSGEPLRVGCQKSVTCPDLDIHTRH
jgi:hypothetical protein